MTKHERLKNDECLMSKRLCLGIRHSCFVIL